MLNFNEIQEKIYEYGSIINAPKDVLKIYPSPQPDGTPYIKINNNEWVNKLFSTSRLYINKPVPNSIKEAPSEGWKELPTWAK